MGCLNFLCACEDSGAAALAKDCLCVAQQLVTAPFLGSCVEGEVSIILADGLPRVVKFQPDRRLQYGATYLVSVEGILPATGGDVPLTATSPSGNFTFTTFAPEVLSSVSLRPATQPAATDAARPLDITVLNDGSLALAMGKPNEDDFSRGFAVVDVRDPYSPVYQYEREAPTGGRSIAVQGLGPVPEYETPGGETHPPISVPFIGVISSMESRSAVTLYDALTTDPQTVAKPKRMASARNVANPTECLRGF